MLTEPGPYLPVGEAHEDQLHGAERKLDAATGRTALNAAAKKLMQAKAELKRLEV